MLNVNEMLDYDFVFCFSFYYGDKYSKIDFLEFLVNFFKNSRQNYEYLVFYIGKVKNGKQKNF